LSARRWSTLVNVAKYEYTTTIPCELRDLLLALEKVVEEEVGQEAESNTSIGVGKSESIVEVEMEDIDNDEYYCRAMAAARKEA
jgi:hypothetical protein